MRCYNRLSLFLWTARYLSPSQAWHRFWSIVRKHWRQIRAKQAPKPIGWKLASYKPLYAGLSDISHQDPWADDVSTAVKKAKGVFERRFYFLHHSHTFSKEVDWHDPKLSQLWRYHLHYFEYINDLLVWLAMGQPTESFQTFQRLAESWICGNQKLSGDGWHPYTISLRAVNWVHALSAFQSQLSNDEQFYQRFLSSLYGQGRVLAKELELDVRGNHLLKNLKALIWLGIVFKGPEPEKWLNVALRLLKRELQEQILADGGHFERTPGYHLIVLKDCLEIGVWLRHNQNSSPDWLEAALCRMLDYLFALLPPDGKVPLLKDTAWDAAPRPEDLLAVSALYFDEPTYKYSDEFGLYPFLLFGLSGRIKFKGWPSQNLKSNSSAFPESGYYVMRDDTRRDYLIFDVGKPCPDYLPAHAHADMFSYELMVGGQRVVVDSGVYEYTAGPWRDFFRSTRAHNTVEVAGKNQSEVWDSFRVARRATPEQLVWKTRDRYVLAQGRTDGYRRLSVPVMHRRTLLWQKGCFWLVVDELLGEGITSAASYVHFDPQLKLEELNDSTWQVKGCVSPLWLCVFGEQNHSIVKGEMEPVREGWYSEKFGELVPNTVLVLDKETNLPFCYGYVISMNERAEVYFAFTPKKCYEINVIYAQNQYKLQLGIDGVTYSE